MLAKSDLQAIEKLVRGVVREEIETESEAIREELTSEILNSRMRIQNDVDEVKNRVKNVDIKLTKVHKDLKKENKDILDFLDKQDVRLHKRVTRIENHLNLPPLQAA
jgi:copper chaperone CopZ